MKRTKQVRENEVNEEEERQKSEEITTDGELPEEFYHGLEDLTWNLSSLEQLLYISLPACVQRALLCNLAQQFGIWTFHNNILPCRLISYVFLPYTLPATALISFIYRFVCWVKKIPHQALNAGRGFQQEVFFLLRLVITHLRGLLLNRFLLFQIPTLVPKLAVFFTPWTCFPSFSLTSLPFSPLLSLALRFLPQRLYTSTSNTQPENRSQTLQRSFLSFHLAGSGAFYRQTENIRTDAEPLSSTFLLQLNLQLEIDSHPETQTEYEGRLLLEHRNTEVDETLSSPCISYMDVQEED